MIKIYPIKLSIVLFAFTISFIYCSNWNIVDLMPNRGVGVEYRLHWKLIDNKESVQFKVSLIL